MTTATTENVRSFLRSVGSSIVTVEFIKRDGSIRQITFNPRDRQEIKGTNTANLNPDTIRVRDFNIARTGQPAWRSFNVSSIRRIKANRQVFNFTI